MNMIIEPISAFNDNYIWLIKKSQKKEAICVDPGDAAPVLAYLKQHHLTLTHILITHHHFDHIGGLAQLKKIYPQAISIGPYDSRISHLDQKVKEGETIHIDSVDLAFNIIETPGHTKTHICFYNMKEGLLFCGDTLFSGGCGRLFEGDAKQMLTSLDKLTSLPPHTKIFCAHEYTYANLQFAQHIEPNNAYIIKILSSIKPNMLTLPSTLEKEQKMNPFLRCSHPNIVKKSTEYVDFTPNKTETFRIIRELKDNF